MPLITVLPSTTIHDAAAVMLERDLSALPVINDGMLLLGIVSEHDIARALALDELDPYTTQVKSIMTHEVLCVGPDIKISDAANLMHEAKVHHLPVIRHGMLISVVSLRDINEMLIRQQAGELRSLEEYVLGYR